VLRFAPLLFSVVLLLHADTQPAEMVNEGKPIHIPFQCVQEELQSLGLDCSEDEPCPVYLELSAIESGARLFVTGNIHTPTATLSSILLATSDDGKTWSEPYRRLRFSALDQIQFFDLANGWIAGEVVQTLPRDPFLLITNDGGKTWKERPIVEDGHSGSIEHFRFESAKTGALVIGSKGSGYELYGTTDGGESWALRQSSAKAINIPGASTQAETTWRLRPDRKNHAYNIEKRDTNGWHVIAGFLVDVAACK